MMHKIILILIMGVIFGRDSFFYTAPLGDWMLASICAFRCHAQRTTKVT